MKRSLWTSLIAILTYALLIELFTLMTAHAQNVPESLMPDCDSIARAERAYRRRIAGDGLTLATNLKKDVASANRRIINLTDDLTTEQATTARLRSENRTLRREIASRPPEQPKQLTRVGKLLRTTRDGLAVVGGVVIVTALTLFTLH